MHRGDGNVASWRSGWNVSFDGSTLVNRSSLGLKSHARNLLLSGSAEAGTSYDIKVAIADGFDLQCRPEKDLSFITDISGQNFEFPNL